MRVENYDLSEILNRFNELERTIEAYGETIRYLSKRISEVFLEVCDLKKEMRLK